MWSTLVLEDNLARGKKPSARRIFDKIIEKERLRKMTHLRHYGKWEIVSNGALSDVM